MHSVASGPASGGRSRAVVYHRPLTDPTRISTAMRKALSLLIAAVLVSGCGIVYRQPVFQGNLLESKNVEQLKVGMTRRQVRRTSPPVSTATLRRGGRVGHEEHRRMQAPDRAR